MAYVSGKELIARAAGKAKKSAPRFQKFLEPCKLPRVRAEATRQRATGGSLPASRKGVLNR